MSQGLLSKFLFGSRIGRLLPVCMLSRTLVLRLGFFSFLSLSLTLCGFHILGFAILLLICLFGWSLLALRSRLSRRIILSSNLCPNIPQHQKYGWSCHTHIMFDLVYTYNFQIAKET